MTKRVGRGGIEQVMQQKGWKGNSEGKMDREVIVCYSVDTIHLHME